MAAAKCTDTEFIEIWRRLGSPQLIAEHLGVALRMIYRRRDAIEKRHGISLPTHNSQRADAKERRRHSEGRVDLSIENGVVLVFSDAHYHPGIVSTAHRALVSFVKMLKPVAVICNGDAFDGAQISRHPRIGWDTTPTVLEELRAVDERLSEIEAAVPPGCKLIWPLGNHDARYETFLAANVSQFQGVDGFHLKDKFPGWAPCWACWINDDTVVKHRWHNGIHATFNNTVKSGVNIVTGHLHQLKVTPWSDYNGRRFGVDTGTLADPYGPQFFNYTELNPVNWHSGFAVLTFKDGKLLQPELVQKYDEDSVEFRGHVLHADTAEIL